MRLRVAGIVGLGPLEAAELALDEPVERHVRHVDQPGHASLLPLGSALRHGETSRPGYLSAMASTVASFQNEWPGRGTPNRASWSGDLPAANEANTWLLPSRGKASYPNQSALAGRKAATSTKRDASGRVKFVPRCHTS